MKTPKRWILWKQNKDGIMWKEKDVYRFVEIRHPSHAFTHTSNYVVMVFSSFVKPEIIKEYKTKRGAYTFAKKYMKEHSGNVRI